MSYIQYIVYVYIPMVLTWTSYFVNYKTKTRDVLTFTLQRWTCNECGIGQDLAVLMQSIFLLNVTRLN